MKRYLVQYIEKDNWGVEWPVLRIIMAKNLEDLYKDLNKNRIWNLNMIVSEDV